MSARYIVRLDDIAPNMHWENYLRLKKLFETAGVRPILGVIPDNQDLNLLKFPTASTDFWDEIKSAEEKGWGIAQHGYQHRYETRCSGLLGINSASEFAGLPFDVQHEKLRKGQEILGSHGLRCETFMAPAHSFDETTLAALLDLRMRSITDGFALYPFSYRGLLFVPQLLARPRWMPFGVHTCCIHPNELQERDLACIESFVRRYSNEIIPFAEAHRYVSRRFLNRAAGELLKRLLRAVRTTRRSIGRLCWSGSQSIRPR